ncbi:hypothetical protein A6F68_00600 [Tsuneonella dongtanensis]|uniref:Biopolymer transport protein ExbD/TolR n=1 Tax=Tsuneonella dongtanensis TaxID=692370 RepID=A0A1B2AAC8_9SPHN|nr:biopolymer transporter ExbD [Tsuneonella dongtanensis]ANY19133.1 hypothetical protein A6F68_00600 [Tsuneonella dongtanensis]
MPTDRRRFYRPVAPFDHGRPIATLALAPFAGVLLTMTLVFAALRPPVTHALVVDLPIPNPSDHSAVLSPVYNRLIVTADGRTLWNGSAVTEAQLRLILIGITDDSPQPALLFHPEADAPYARALQVMEIVRQEGLIDRCFRFAEIARHRRYERAPDPDEILPAQSAECAIAYY